MSTKRIFKEYEELSKNPPEGFTVALPDSASLHTWHITVRPPPTTPYHGGLFGIILTLPSDYPFKAPVIKFITRIYHPNVTDDTVGNVCLAVLKSENWKPSTKIAAVLEAVRNLLVEPQPDDPLEERIADEYRRDRPTWEKRAKEYTQRYAKGEPVFSAAP